MSYVLATINRGGFIKLLDKRSTVHRETLDLHTSGESCYARIEAAKANHLNAKVFPSEEGVVLQLRKDGGVASVYTTKANTEEVKRLLRIWSGCYEAWPVKVFNG
jgi:hypothetical protein